MQVQIKIISSHNISRHMDRINSELFDENMRGLKKNELSVLNLSEPPKGFSVSESDEFIEGMGYNGIEFFRRYLLDDFFTITYRLDNEPDTKDRIKEEVNKAVAVSKTIKTVGIEEDLYPIIDYDYTYKIRVSRNGFFHVLMEKELSCDENYKELEEIVHLFLQSKYKGFIPLIIGDFFVQHQKNVQVSLNSKLYTANFLPSFYSDEMYQKKLSRNIFPQHSSYIFARLPWCKDRNYLQKVFDKHRIVSIPKSITTSLFKVIETDCNSLEKKLLQKYYRKTEDHFYLHDVFSDSQAMENLFSKTDIFVIKQNIKTLQVNPNISMVLNDNLCFIKCREIPKKDSIYSIAIHSFTRMLEYLFTISTELETILKNTTLMLEDIAKVNKGIIEEEKNRNWDTIDREIQRLMQKLSRNYRMLPHIRDIMVGTTAFKNMEIVFIVEEILEIFHLYKTEKWIKQNIDEINNFITHFHTIQSYEREKRSNKRLNRIFLLLSGLQVPSFVKDFGESYYQTPTPDKFAMLAGNAFLFVILISLAIYFHIRSNKL
ncbi:MAG: hypothetical protein KDK90_04505 [Leptospiraceae bacterium]|nr:hypothetical protein [Leptospiraceae bacterium]